MLYFLFPSVVIVMIGFIWYQEGWKKGLKILLFFIGSFILFVSLAIILNLSCTAVGIIRMLLWGGWAIGLCLYKKIKDAFSGRF